jgi:hypothetical protein
MKKKNEASEAEQTPLVIETASVPALRPQDLKVTRKLTLDIASVAKIGEVIFLAQSEVEIVELPSKFTENGKANAAVIDVVDVLRGLEYRLALNSIAANELRRYPPPLTGQYFAIRVGEMKPGKRYRDTQVFKVERVG